VTWPAKTHKIVRASLLLALTGALLSACTPEPPHAPSSVPEPNETELGAGWDEPNDTPTTPVQDLDYWDLSDVLRIGATADNKTATVTVDGKTHRSCDSTLLDMAIQYRDAAAGHRYGTLQVTNTTDKPCVVQGFPGFGAIGEWGNSFKNVAEQMDPINPNTSLEPVLIQPGKYALANMEWTGELGGAESEPIAAFVVQMFRNSEPQSFPVISLYSENDPPNDPETGMPLPNTGIDISTLTTVRIGPFYVMQ
jgi:hypothetical protein